VLLSLLALHPRPTPVRTMLWAFFAEKWRSEKDLRQFQRWSCRSAEGERICCEWFVRAFPESEDYCEVCVLSFYVERSPKRDVSPDGVINVYFGMGTESTRSPSLQKSTKTEKFKNRSLEFQRKRKELKKLVRKDLSRYKALCIDRDTDLELIKEMLGVACWQIGIRDESISKLLFVGSLQGSRGFVQDPEIMEILGNRFVDPEHPGDYAALKSQLRKRKLWADQLSYVQPLEQFEISLTANPSAEESTPSFDRAVEEAKKTFRGEQARKKQKGAEKEGASCP